MTIARRWKRFWFLPQDPSPLGLFRIAFGILVAVYGLLLFPDRMVWFSEKGTLPLVIAEVFNASTSSGPRIELLPTVSSEIWLDIFFVIFLLFTLFLTLGLWARPSSLVVFLSLSALHNRNGVINNSGDTVMIIMAAYLLLTPAGAACSLDRLRRVVRGEEGRTPPRQRLWAQRLMQLQVSVIYLSTALGKVSGSEWRDGTAAYYPLHVPDLTRFTVPWIDANHLWLINLLTYGTVATELALATLIWVPSLRLYVLAAGTVLHLGIEYSLNIPLFSFLMIASYITFLTEADLRNLQSWLQRPLRPIHLYIISPVLSDHWRPLRRTLAFFDALTLISFPTSIPLPASTNTKKRSKRTSEVSVEQVGLDADVLQVTDQDGRLYSGMPAIRALILRLPALSLIFPFTYLPGCRQVLKLIAFRSGLIGCSARYRDTYEVSSEHESNLERSRR